MPRLGRPVRRRSEQRNRLESKPFPRLQHGFSASLVSFSSQPTNLLAILRRMVQNE
jgi:hypothetical protein